MTGTVGSSTRIYGALLRAYPPELRRDYGAEMTQVFLEDLDDARLRRGWAGVARVWWRSACELIRIALPAQLEKPAVVVPAISFAFCQFIMSAQLMVAFHRSPGLREQAGLAAAVALGPSVISALTAFAAVRAGNRSLPAPLGLDSRSCWKPAI